MRALFAGVLGVLLVLALITLLVFWDAWRSPQRLEPEEDFAHGVSLRRKLEREGWLRYARRRMRIVCVLMPMDGMHVKMRKVRRCKTGTEYQENYESYDYGRFGSNTN